MHPVLYFNIDIPYTLEDLSVVVPQASQYKKRISWFLKQFVEATPEAVVKNTVVTYDPEDEYTETELKKYNIRGKIITPPQSTYKIQGGLKDVKTRLVVRMANDTYLRRTDWADLLIDQFNSMSEPQLIGAAYPSGDVNKPAMEKFFSTYPWYRKSMKWIDYYTNSDGITSLSVYYLHGYFMASQTYVLQSLYPQIVELNDGDMGKEDCLVSHLASAHRIKIVCWDNLGEFCKHSGKHTADFEGEENELPLLVKADSSTEPRPVFNIMEVPPPS